jgi:hypothetical protein
VRIYTREIFVNQLFDLCVRTLGFCRKYRSTVAVVISAVAVLVDSAGCSLEANDET